MRDEDTPDRRLYVDHAATTPLRAEASEAMGRLSSPAYGNPSALYREGRTAREALEECRERLLRVCGGSQFSLCFTSGGTEGNSAAVLGAFLEARLRGVGAKGSTSTPHIVTTAVEHPAGLEAAGLVEELDGAVTRLGVDEHGRVDPDEVERALRAETVLVSVMAANNETGVLEPVAAIGERVRARGVLCHVDAVQLLGKKSFRLDALPVDLVTVSAHKIHGPRGIGGLFVRRGVRIAPLLRGGLQEGGLRAGTEPLAAVAGFVAAAECATREVDAVARRVASIRDAVRERVLDRFSWARVNTPESGALPHFLNMSFPRIEGESLVRRLDVLGVAASTGSACNVGARKPSHVLRAMGLDERSVRGSLRLSFGRENRPEDAELLFGRLERAVDELASIAPL